MEMTRSILLTPASLAEQADFTIGDVQVCPATRTVTGRGGSTQIEPRVMQVLIVLAEADGAVVTRDALLERCWGGVFVGDDSLNRAISGVRRIASGVAAGSFEIETISRTGYRLVPHPEAGQLPDEAAATGEGGMKRRWVLGGALAAAAGGAAYWASRTSGPDRAAGLIEESRALLRQGMPATDNQAIALLERAVDVSPGNAGAWGLLALVRARKDEHAILEPESPAAEIERAARRALALDPGNADAKAAMAIAIPYYGDWLAAEQRFDAVLAAHPDHIVTKDSRSFLLGAVGRMKESALDRLAFSNDALFDANLQFRHAYAFWFLDRVPEADRTVARGLEMWPRHPGLWFARLWLFADTGRFDRAIAQIDDEAARPQLPPPMVGTLRAAMSAAGSRQPAEIDAAVERVLAGVGRNVAAVVNAMMLLNLMGATDAAFDVANAYYLEQGPIISAMEWRPGQPVVPDQGRRKTNMLFTPTAAGMQRDPRFAPLMEAMGLADYWRKRGILPDYQRSA